MLSNTLDYGACFVNGELVDQIFVFPFLIDPSDQITDTNGFPIPGATVVLEYESGGSFIEVDAALGSPLIDPAINPQFSSASGRYGWDVEAGVYRVSVEKAGCTSVTTVNPS